MTYLLYFIIHYTETLKEALSSEEFTFIKDKLSNEVNKPSGKEISKELEVIKTIHYNYFKNIYVSYDSFLKKLNRSMHLEILNIDRSLKLEMVKRDSSSKSTKVKLIDNFKI